MSTAKIIDRRHAKEPDRKIMRARDLSEAEIAVIQAAKVGTDNPYELDDLDEDGQMAGMRHR